MKALLEKFEKKNPKARVLDLTIKNEKYRGEYALFNIDILKEILSKTSLEYKIVDEEIHIRGDKKLAKKMLFACHTLCELDKDNKLIILRPYVTATEIMSLACKLLKNFEKNA